jgi:hypothetical protein
MHAMVVVAISRTRMFLSSSARSRYVDSSVVSPLQHTTMRVGEISSDHSDRRFALLERTPTIAIARPGHIVMAPFLTVTHHNRR